MTPSTQPAWNEVRVLVPLGWHELVAETLALGPCTSVVIGRPSLGTDEVPEGFDWVRTFVIETDDTPELRARIGRELSALAERTGAEELAALVPEFKRLPPEDWASSWQKTWKPMRVGRLCIVRPGTGALPRADDVRLELEPGGAFGTGRHATTRTCLRVLQERPLEGARVLDAGSGSGILSVAAALLGARRVIGFDLDPNALPYALELARANAVTGRCDLRVAGFELLAAERGPFDVVIANIYSDVIQGHARDLAERMAHGGWFVFSGCPQPHAAETRRAVEAAGLVVEEERVRGRWHTLAGRRP
jgi:ribosomal protein L11 methyltransferase